MQWLTLGDTCVVPTLSTEQKAKVMQASHALATLIEGMYAVLCQRSDLHKLQHSRVERHIFRPCCTVLSSRSGRSEVENVAGVQLWLLC